MTRRNYVQQGFREGRGLRKDRREISSWRGWVWNLGREQSGFGAGHEEKHDRSPGTGTGGGPRGTGVSARAGEA